jgi:hypothetical protein
MFMCQRPSADSFFDRMDRLHATDTMVALKMVVGKLDRCILQAINELM